MKISYSFECEPDELIAMMGEVRSLIQLGMQARSMQPPKTPTAPAPQAAPPAAPAPQKVAESEPEPLPDEEEIENASGTLPRPQNDPNVGRKLDLPPIQPEIRQAAKVYFRDLVLTWAENFDAEGPQPDRLKLLTDFGCSAHLVPVLIMAYEKLSLQRLILDALFGYDTEGRTLNLGNPTVMSMIALADKLAMNMVQVSHIACPDLAGTYDYTTRWKR